MHLTNTKGPAKLATTLFGPIFHPNMYSPGWVLEGITIYGESQLLFPYFNVDKAAKKIYGKSIKLLFSEWKEYEEERAKEWRIEGEQLTKEGYWEMGYSILEAGRLYYVREYLKKTGAYKYFNFSEIVKLEGCSV
ncbi:TPA: hypothetical protein DCX15_06120 [bacterium]|nr:hypothetical protein [bacterium]